MKTQFKARPAPEVANILRQALGPIRAWEDCLADMRRPVPTTNVYGFLLFPVGEIFDGRLWRPAYHDAEIFEFVMAVRAANPAAKAGIPIQFHWAELDLADGETWRSRKLTQVVPMKRPVTTSLPRVTPVPPLTITGV